MSGFDQEQFDSLFIVESCVITGESDFHVNPFLFQSPVLSAYPDKEPEWNTGLQKPVRLRVEVLSNPFWIDSESLLLQMKEARFLQTRLLVSNRRFQAPERGKPQHELDAISVAGFGIKLWFGVSRKFTNIDVPPANFATVSLKHDRASGLEWGVTIPEVLHLGTIHNQLVVQPD